jgi:type I restriction enzyme S subunit
MSEWKDFKLGDVVTFQRGFDITSRDFKQGVYPVISSSGINGYHDTFMVKGPGVIIGRKGTLGTVHYISKDYWPHDTTLWVKNFHNNYPLFIYYFLKIQGFEQYDVGTSNPTLNRNHIHLLPVSIPNYDIQQSIAEVLSSLDDKIDLLHRQNKTLEQMAETLFRQWFVEEAKEDWEEKPLDQLAEYLNGLALQKFPVIPGKPTLPAIKIREMNQGITEATDIVSAEIPEKYIVNDGDILFSWSGSLDVIIWTGGKGALNQHLFKVSSSIYPKWLIYFSTRLFLPEFRDIANDKATTMGHIQRSHLTQSVLKIPPQKIIEKSDKIISDLFDKIIHNKIQIRSIEKLRDTLLPKLMNGSVRINSN